ncbi:hypothetical protein LTR78_005714 [Recurvomyces mirabilis]|uniref:Uncharacterized protein n=1 Tax=Recurvomyces mirabilis TaxID=574656 RepID=A0AAE1C115_9PEZI|nr:hypothetical protein LTR78_005714 [Recurvomyces mirabilis]KAK5154094.1 hypothetical protein LTS14_006779 [Recurvomyces mirabilis]
MTRTNSSESSSLSNIDVQAAAGALLEESSIASPDRVSRSTPPTSLGESASVGSAQKSGGDDDGISGRRSRRVRGGGVSTYNLKQLSDAQLPATTAASSRNVSGLTGRTLVNAEDDEQTGTPFGRKVGKALDMDWEIPAGATRENTGWVLERKPSVRDRVKKAAGKVGSVLGKRGRDIMEAGKRKLSKKTKVQAHEVEEDEEDDEDNMPRWKKELDTGPRGLLDELDLDAEVDLPPPAKKARLATKAVLREMAQPPAAPPPAAKASAPSKKMKRWQKEGLYVGQSADFDGAQIGGRQKLQKKRPVSSASNEAGDDVPSNSTPPFMTLPMFAYLDKTRDFTIPYDVFAPSWKKGDEKPKDWHQVNKNRLIGEAKDLWERSERLPASMCVCSPPGPGELGCDDVCLNRVMQYECNDDNCNLSSETCGNRAFAELSTRTKKGGPFDVGVEVLKTANRGFGVRSCRTWAAGQIIMEYTGEIVSEGECQRRMREDYKDKQCYYLMELERGLIIDGTKGSMARFINHSCEPNCEVRMVKVNGTPRMGVFAGPEGITTGQELTYDYNFDNFGETQQKCYCGAPSCRGSLSKRLNATEQKKQLKAENERKRKAEIEAQRHAGDEERKKKVKTSRGSNWRGWVAIDDPETKERLKAEKKEREETEKGSSRARRLAARRGSLPGVERAPLLRKKDSSRRKTVHEAVLPPEDQEAVTVDEQANEGAQITISPRKDQPHNPSTASKFTEDLPRSDSVNSTSTITRKTKITITETEKAVHRSQTRESETLASSSASEAANRKKQPIKDAVKSVGQAVKDSLLGATGSGKSERSSGGRMKQSTLMFAKLG